MKCYTDLQSDMLITLKEPWVFRRIFKEAMNFVPIVPIDHQPVADDILLRLQTAFKVITVSRFGQWELRNKKIESTYIPMAVATFTNDILNVKMNGAKCGSLTQTNL